MHQSLHATAGMGRCGLCGQIGGIATSIDYVRLFFWPPSSSYNIPPTERVNNQSLPTLERDCDQSQLGSLWVRGFRIESIWLVSL